MKRLLAALVIAALAAALGACTTFVPGMLPMQQAPARATYDPTVVALRAKLLEGAQYILNTRSLTIRGRHFNADCTGLVLAIYWYAGIDLSRDFNKFTGGGVERLYRTLERYNLLYSTTEPLTGDLIFWDNTYDHNEDGRWDDPLSHAGMVTSVDPDGTIAYIHYHVTLGIHIDYMNLRNPSVQSVSEWGHVKVINSPMRLVERGKPHPPHWLAGQLYRALGLAYLLE